MERTVKVLKSKLTAAKKGGSLSGLSVFDAEWALEKLEEYEVTSIRTPIETPPVVDIPPENDDRLNDDLAQLSQERDRARRQLKLAVAALRNIHSDPSVNVQRSVKAVLQELGEI